MENTTKKPSPPETAKFNFADFRITSVQFKSNENLKVLEGQSVNISTELATQAHFNKEEKILSIVMGIRNSDGEEKTPFSFEVRGVGTFKFEQEPSERTFEMLSTINCPAIMFPYLREFVAELTRRSGLAPLHLPPVNFVAIAEQKKKQEVKQK